MLTLPPFHMPPRPETYRAVLEWFSEWAVSRERLEEELGTDIHLEEGIHRLLLQEALQEEDAEVCLDLLTILQVRLAPVRDD